MLDTIEREFSAQHIQHLRAIAKRVEIELQQVKSDLPKYQARTSADLYDPITKLPNKQYFIQKLQQHLQIQHIHAQYGQIAVIQIQRFRHIARIYQDTFCNQVVLEFSHRIRTSLTNDAIIAKFSNDKYIVFLPAVFAQSQVDYFYHVKEILEKPVLNDGTPVYINAQGGLTFISKHTDTLKELIANTQQHAAHQSKHNSLTKVHIRYNNAGMGFTILQRIAELLSGSLKVELVNDGDNNLQEHSQGRSQKHAGSSVVITLEFPQE